MTTQIEEYRMSARATKKSRLTKTRMLTSVLPFVALAVPGTAYAQQVSNTATVTAPSGATDSNPANNTATDTDTVLANIVAANDTATVPSSPTVQNNVLNVFTGDTVNGAAATTANADLFVSTPVQSELTFDTSTGEVGVVAGTVAGTYTFDYQICEEGSTTNCQTATVTVTVTPTIIAVDDSVSVAASPAAQADVLNVFTGDTVDGIAATTANADLFVSTAVPSELTFDTSTGSIGVVAGTVAGTYAFDYEICEEGATSGSAFCQIATATVTVFDIDAVDDGPVTVTDGVTGEADVVNVLTNDEVNGVQATVSNVDITVTSPATGIGGSTIVPVLDTTDGTIDVPANTPAGTYTISYEIEDPLNPGSTDTATATIIVSPTVDLSILKTNNDSDGVRSGDTLTYVLTIANAGPDAAVGAGVTDAPGAGLTCPATGTLTFGGTATAGAPAGSPTVGDLTGSGITLGTIGSGENVTITYTCTVD